MSAAVDWAERNRCAAIAKRERRRAWMRYLVERNGIESAEDYRERLHARQRRQA